METSDLRGIITAHVKIKDGVRRLSCHAAHVIADTHQVSLRAIGEVCNAEGIRIIHCELGCFEDRKK